MPAGVSITLLSARDPFPIPEYSIYGGSRVWEYVRVFAHAHLYRKYFASETKS